MAIVEGERIAGVKLIWIVGTIESRHVDPRIPGWLLTMNSQSLGPQVALVLDRV